MEIQKIDPVALASITTGIMMTDEFHLIHEAIEWIMGRLIWTHELRDVADEATALILRQFPDMPVGEPEDWKACRETVRASYGELVEVNRGSTIRTQSPVSTAVGMLGDRL